MSRTCRKRAPRCRLLLPASTSCRSEIVAITCATGEEGYFPALKESCRRLGYDFRTCGAGQEWQGFGWSVRQMEAIANDVFQSSPDRLILLLDGYDTLVTMEEARLRHEYECLCTRANAVHQRSERWVVVCEEHPEKDRSVLYNLLVWPVSKWYMNARRTILNSGMVLGPARHVLSYLRHVGAACSIAGDDDERALNTLFDAWTGGKNDDDASACVTTPKGCRFPLLVDNSLFVCGCERSVIRLLVDSILTPSSTHCPNEIQERAARQEIAVLHGIWNSNMDFVCEARDLPLPARRKLTTQADLRRVRAAVRLFAFSSTLVLCAAAAMYNVSPRLHTFLRSTSVPSASSSCTSS